MTVDAVQPAYGDEPEWSPVAPRLRPLRLLISFAISVVSVWLAAGIVPGVGLGHHGAAVVVAAAIAVVNAVLPPVIAALRLPWTVAVGFLSVLLVDALALVIAADVFPNDLRVDSFGDAILMSLVTAAISIALSIAAGTNDDDEYSMRVVRRIARRQGREETHDVPGIVFLEIDGLALPVLRRAMRDGNAPNLANWMAEHDYELTEWVQQGVG